MSRKRLSAAARKRKEKARATRQAPADQDMARDMTNVFRFWLTCGRDACRRAAACRGEPERCFDTEWKKLPEFQKVWYRAAIRAMHERGDPAQAMSIADAAVASWQQSQQADAAAHRQAAENTTPPAPEAVPRIRTP
jgi:hypothetical protein